MSTLPDIDTTSVGGITFYNVKDEQGVSDSQFDVMDFSDWAPLETVEIYDNGIDGYLNMSIVKSSEQYNLARFRCKDDGWLVIWSPIADNYFGASEFNDGSRVDLRGSYNFYSIATSNEPWQLLFDALSHAGYDVQSTPGETVLGYYDFNAPEASNITYARSDWSFTSSVDRKYHIAEAGEPYALLSSVGGEPVLGKDTVKNDTGVFGVVDVLNNEGAGYVFENDVVPGTSYTAKGDFTNGAGGRVLSAWA